MLQTESLSSHIYEVFEFSNGLLDMLGSSSGKGLPEMQIHATLDDVGNEKDGISAVVGYVAYGDDWKKFNWRWGICLEQLKRPFLHTAKYLHEFWLSDHEITDEDICVILAPFIETVKATLLAEGAFPLCIITDCSAYEGLTEQEKKFIRPPAENSFEVAVAIASRVLRNPLHISDHTSIQMDESYNAPNLYARYEAMKRESEEFKSHLGALCFCDDEKHAPVQAADMLGNIMLKSFRKFERGKELPRAMRELTGNGKLILQRYTLDSLQSLAKIRMNNGRMDIPKQ
jgi:hypothetical protein